MKPVHIGLLVAAGALGGFLVTKMATQAPAPAPQPAPVVAQQQPPPAPPSMAEPLQPPAAAEPQPSPFPEKEKPKAKPEPRKSAARPRTSAPVVARNETPAPAPPAPAAPAAQPATPAPAPAPSTPEPPAPAMVREPERPFVPPPPPPPHKVTVPAGTTLPVRLVEALSTERNHAGDTFTATLDQPLTVDGFVIAERGARLEGKVVDAKESGRVRGVGSLSIALTRLRTSDGQNINISTETFVKEAPKSVGEDVKRGAAATGIGAAIGAIAGGGKGAAIGAAVGAAAGTGGALATRGKPAELASETRLTFRVSEPVTITEHRQ